MTVRLCSVSIMLFATVALTGSRSGACPDYQIGVSAIPVAVYVNGKTSTIWARVTRGNVGVEDHTIHFTLSGPSDPGSVSPSVKNTDFGGWASTTYTSGVDYGEVTVKAQDFTEPGHPTATCKIIVFEISQSAWLWWFNGEDPANYDIEVTLTAHGTSTGSFYWKVADAPWGFDKAALVDSGNLVQWVTRTDDPSVNLKSKAPSTDTGDVHIDFKWNGLSIITIGTHVYAPDHLARIAPFEDDHPLAPIGYLSRIHYSIEHQFNQPLPSTVPWNEQWTTGDQPDWETENWTQVQEEGWPVNPNDAFDTIAWWGPTPPYFPSVLHPGDAGAGAQIDHWGQRWWVGSSVVRQERGVPVQDNVFQRHRGYGRHN